MLSERERQILLLVATGLSNRQIAGQLDISENTVKVHVRNIFAKIDVASRTEASLYAVRHGLMDVPVPPQPVEPLPAVVETTLPTAEVPPPPNLPSVALRRPLPHAGRIAVGVAMTLALSLAVGYGVWAPQPVAPLEVIKPINDARWKQLPGIKQPRAHVVLAVVNGDLYALGGGDDVVQHSRVERFDSTTQQWQPAPPLPFALAKGVSWSDGSGVWVIDARGDGTIHHWDGIDWRTTATQNAPVGITQLVRWQGKWVALAGAEGSAQLWSYEQEWTPLTVLPTDVAAAALVVNAEQLLVVSTDGAVYAYATEKNAWLRDGELGQPWGTSVAYSVLGAVLVVQSDAPTTLTVYSPGQGVVGRQGVPAFVRGGIQLVPWQMQLVIGDNRGISIVMYQALYQNFAPIAQ
jgi:DNA-binding CsgD family transcriptional regulator